MSDMQRTVLYVGSLCKWPDGNTQQLRYWRGTQVVRERSAKPLYVGSIPTRASNLFLQFPDSTGPTCLSRLRSGSASMGENGAKTGSGSDKNRTKFGARFN